MGNVDTGDEESVSEGDVALWAEEGVAWKVEPVLVCGVVSLTDARRPDPEGSGISSEVTSWLLGTYTYQVHHFTMESRKVERAGRLVPTRYDIDEVFLLL